MHVNNRYMFNFKEATNVDLMYMYLTNNSLMGI